MQQQAIYSVNILDALSLLMEWISQEHLRPAINFNLPLNNNTQIIEKSYKILPVLADLIINFSTASNFSLLKKYQLAFIEFIYWSLLHSDASFQNKVI